MSSAPVVSAVPSAPVTLSLRKSMMFFGFFKRKPPAKAQLHAAITDSWSFQHNGALILEGYMCSHFIHLSHRIRTPLGASVSVIQVMVDVTFTMNSFNDVVIHEVGLTQSVDGNAISRQGEGFRLAGVDPHALRDTVTKELDSKGDRMRRAMYSVWKGSTEARVDCSTVQVPDESQREKELRIAAELGIHVMPFMKSETLWAAIYEANAKRDREALIWDRQKEPPRDVNTKHQQPHPHR